MPFNLGGTEMFLGLVIVLLLFGAKRIPEIAGSFGKGIKEFKRNMGDAQRALEEPSRTDRLDQPVTPAERLAVGTDRQDDVVAPEPKRLL